LERVINQKEAVAAQWKQGFSIEFQLKNGLFKKNAVFMKYNAVDEIYSYDKDFAVIEGINRAEP